MTGLLAILLFIIVSAIGGAYLVVRGTSAILREILAKKQAAFLEDITGKEHYSVWIPDEQFIWRAGDYESLLYELNKVAAIHGYKRTDIEFSYKIDDQGQNIYMWLTYMELFRRKCEFNHFRTADQVRADAARINAAIAANK